MILYRDYMLILNTLFDKEKIDYHQYLFYRNKLQQWFVVHAMKKSNRFKISSRG
ncbi:hypothetical protein [Cytobacillus oceanisediminis]|uniref:hypothetical protein n=1 Tax=Cytobacillus oceanisediminis TaxID=665099 RepID=UPI001FB56B24|nr:hypothetical protein [Cytobacillus oceanisediminis]UOE58119.1 hypothetical protein IRB79_26800 [Cytobacillus oceanisediminis]